MLTNEQERFVTLCHFLSCSSMVCWDERPVELRSLEIKAGVLWGIFILLVSVGQIKRDKLMARDEGFAISETDKRVNIRCGNKKSKRHSVSARKETWPAMQVWHHTHFIGATANKGLRWDTGCWRVPLTKESASDWQDCSDVPLSTKIPWCNPIPGSGRAKGRCKISAKRERFYTGLLCFANFLPASANPLSYKKSTLSG